MPDENKPVRVGIRVMQLRLTVIGFNIAIVSFQMVRLYNPEDGLRVPVLGRVIHVINDMDLYMALGLSIIALPAFIMSSKIDEEGICTHWPLMAGNLLMFMALSHTVAGFFAPLAATIETVANAFPQIASQIHILQLAAIVIGGAAWFLTTYVGPLVSLKRSHIQHRSKIAFGIAYLLLLLMFCWLTAQTVRVQSSVSADPPGLFLSVLRELVQPLRW